MKKINIVWFRRDLRLDDNSALKQAALSELPILPLFIFDTNIIDELPVDDPRITFIYESLSSINKKLEEYGSSFLILKGDPVSLWEELIDSFDIKAVYINKNYEPYEINRDLIIEILLKKRAVSLVKFKDEVIYEEEEILKSDLKPYTVFTPYKNRWLKKFKENSPSKNSDAGLKNKFLQTRNEFPYADKIGFRISTIKVKPFDIGVIKEYHKYRDYPASDRTSYLGPHLRYGTVSIRQIADLALKENQVFLNELIWREFFIQILYHFQHVVTSNFKPKFDNIPWRNDESEFERWCTGQTGFPLVDAGMRQLNETGYMHNRVRMITAGFLCKDLLIDWRWGEAWFAQKLLDYELSSNNGNWQWAAGTGCDAVPYFRIFNPDSQQKKFDPKFEYIQKWVKDFNKSSYPDPIIEHNFARNRAISAYKSGLKF